MACLSEQMDMEMLYAGPGPFWGLAGQCKIAIPFRDSISEGGIAHILPLFS